MRWHSTTDRTALKDLGGMTLTHLMIRGLILANALILGVLSAEGCRFAHASGNRGITSAIILPDQESEITEANWQQHPKIKAIRQVVSLVNGKMKKGSLKTAQRKVACDEVPYFTLRRIARDPGGAVVWYQDYGEGEDSTADYHHYYDKSGRLRFVLVTIYAANGTREQHRIYFDESGNLIWQTRKLLKGPGYFGPYQPEELVKIDPAKAFAEDPAEGNCKEIKPKRIRTASG